MENNFAENYRPGYKLIFRQTRRTKDGRIERRPNGKPFAMWVKIDDGRTAA